MPSRIPAAVACALALPALAQEPPAASGATAVIDTHQIIAQATASAAAGKATAEAWRQWGDELRASMGALFGESFAGAKVVKGAPYSAEVSTEMQQTLADGNVISRRTGGRVYRDGEGRTRQETVVNGETKSIQLRDPVAGKAWMLLPGTKTAIAMPQLAWRWDAKQAKVLRAGDREIRIDDGKVTLDGKEIPGPIELKAGGKEIRIDNGKVTVDGKDVTAAAHAGGKRVIVKREGGEASGGAVREEVRVHVLRSAEGKEVEVTAPLIAPGSPLLDPMAARHHASILRAKGTTTALGAKEFDGVRAEGKSTVRTIAAGEIGNRNPILITTETWYSPELQVTVHSRHLDPRQGESTYRLTGIRRGEPAAELFQVPEDYKAGKRGRG